jgi:response regulator NasT
MASTFHLSKSNVLLIDDMAREAYFRKALQDSSYTITHAAQHSVSLLKEVEKQNPDIILIDTKRPTRETISSLNALADINPKPVVIFTEQDQPELMRESIQAGVSAFVAGETSPERAKYILDVAVVRFAKFQQLKSDLSSAKQQLESRKWIDQAKALLIEQQNMTEQQAYSSIRKVAMDNGQKMEDVAKNLIAMMQLMNGGTSE